MSLANVCWLWCTIRHCIVLSISVSMKKSVCRFDPNPWVDPPDTHVWAGMIDFCCEFPYHASLCQRLVNQTAACMQQQVTWTIAKSFILYSIYTVVKCCIATLFMAYYSTHSGSTLHDTGGLRYCGLYLPHVKCNVFKGQAQTSFYHTGLYQLHTCVCMCVCVCSLHTDSRNILPFW